MSRITGAVEEMALLTFGVTGICCTASSNLARHTAHSSSEASSIAPDSSKYRASATRSCNARALSVGLCIGSNTSNSGMRCPPTMCQFSNSTKSLLLGSGLLFKYASKSMCMFSPIISTMYDANVWSLCGPTLHCSSTWRSISSHEMGSSSRTTACGPAVPGCLKNWNSTDSQQSVKAERRCASCSSSQQSRAKHWSILASGQ